MGTTAEQLAAFLTSAGVSMAEINIFIASILMSLAFIFVMMIMRGNHKAWSKESIDLGEYAGRTLWLIFLIIIVVYLVN